MKRKKDTAPIIDWFQKNMPNPESELHYKDTFSLLVAVVLSAQCTDKRVNIVTPALMERFPTAAAMAEATGRDFSLYPIGDIPQQQIKTSGRDGQDGPRNVQRKRAHNSRRTAKTTGRRPQNSARNRFGRLRCTSDSR